MKERRNMEDNKEENDGNNGAYTYDKAVELTGNWNNHESKWATEWVEEECDKAIEMLE